MTQMFGCVVSCCILFIFSLELFVLIALFDVPANVLGVDVHVAAFGMFQRYIDIAELCDPDFGSDGGNSVDVESVLFDVRCVLH